MIVAPGSTSVSIDVFFSDDNGAALTGKVATDFPTCKWSSGTNTADTAITLSDLTAITTAHPNDNTAGGIKEREGGWYRLDLPNNVLTSAGRKTITFAETTNKRIIAPPIDVQYIQSDLRQAAGQSQTLDANNVLNVSTKYVGGTLQTARDIGASVLVGDKTGFSLATSSIVTATFGTCDFTSMMKTSLNAATPSVTVSDKTGFSLANGSIVSATFGTCDFTSSMKTSLNAATPTATISVGTGTGQLSLTSGKVLVQSGTGAGQISLSNGAVIVQTGNGTGQIDLLAGKVNLQGTQIFSNTGTWTGDINGTLQGDVAGSVQSDVNGSLHGQVLGNGGNPFVASGVLADLSTAAIAQIVTAIMTDLLVGTDFDTTGSFGKLIKDYLDAAISSRLASAGYIVPPTASDNASATAAQITTDHGSGNYAATGSGGNVTIEQQDVVVQ